MGRLDDWYRRKPITGQEYFAIQEGPAPRRTLPVRDRMEEDGDIVLQRISVYGAYVQDRTIALRKPDLDLFSGEEIAIVDRVIDRLRNKTGKETSDDSHKFLGWEIAKLKESIPYGMAMLDAETILGIERQPLTKEQIEYGRSLETVAQSALQQDE